MAWHRPQVPGSFGYHVVIGHSLAPEGHVCTAMGTAAAVPGHQGSRMDLFPLHPQTRAQKSGGLGAGRGNMGEVAVHSKHFAPEVS